MFELIHFLVAVMLVIFIFGMYHFVRVYTMGYKDDEGEYLVIPHQGPNKDPPLVVTQPRVPVDWQNPPE
jgi:hypothetical protein